VQDVDLGICSGHFFHGDPNRVAVLLPGAFYLPAAPLLWFGREVLQAHGWSVVQVWDQRTTGEDPQQWVDNRLAAALDFISGDPKKVVLAKSVTSLAAASVAAMRVPAIWLTPLLQRPEVAAGLAAAAAPALLVGGSADDLWDAECAARLADHRLIEVVEVAGADHGLQFPGEPARSVAALQTWVTAIDGFVDHLEI
jgi:pimeloyl-ACP methyl ester carboxylesterase